jgi:hypothetical protein
MPSNFPELSSSFRVTAFIDILGWGSLTEGIPTRVLRRMKRAESLDDHEKAYGERLVAQVNRARAIDDATRAILTGLNEICAPADAVGGPGSLRQFWEHQHVVFLRASDCIFAHSASFQNLALFVSELLKRGLNSGILFRAGISAGFVQHLEAALTGSPDVRSRSISLFGDGITSATKAESASRGCGVRALIHERVQSILGEALGHSVHDFSQGPAYANTQLRWWMDFSTIWAGNKHLHLVSPVTREWLECTIHELSSGDQFGWNRETANGRRPIDDTVMLLRELSGQDAPANGH